MMVNNRFGGFRCALLALAAAALILTGCSDDVETQQDSGVEAGGDGPAMDGPGSDGAGPTIKLVILHTNDLHDQMLGWGPNADYTPATTGDDTTLGGFARLAAKIKSERTAAGTTPVLLLDGGDFTQGSLFRWLGTTKAPMLSLMQDMGYDAVTLGNHEYDWTPDGLAGFISAATAQGVKLDILSSNMKYDATSTKDDKVEALQKAGTIKTKVVKTLSNGLKVGLFGILGSDASDVAPNKTPITFEDAVKAAAPIVKDLRENDKVDLVIAVSHSGTDSTGKGDDEDLAKGVTGIDVIISGHTHVALNQAVKVGNTLIVQSGGYGKYLGKLELTIQGGAVTANTVTLLAIDDKIKGDTAIQTKIDGYIQDLDKMLQAYNLTFKQEIAESAFDLTFPSYQETLLGNLITDAYMTAYNALNPTDKADLAIESGGVIRDEILKGKTGKIWFADLYRALPLGIGPDGNPGYPLVDFYINGKELKAGMELMPLAQKLLKNNDYFMQVSDSMVVEYKNTALPYNAVTSVFLGGVAVDLTDTTKCYKVVTNLYVASLLSLVDSATSGALKVEAKEKDCKTLIKDLTTHIVDADTTTAGVQELKAWGALLTFMSKFPDTDNDKIPDVPAAYGKTQGRITAK